MNLDQVDQKAFSSAIDFTRGEFVKYNTEINFIFCILKSYNTVRYATSKDLGIWKLFEKEI